MSRRIAGAFTIENPGMHEYPDSVGMFGSWREPGPVYQLPFRCLYGQRVTNLFVAGRCISAAETMWDLTRVIPVAALSGQAAGTAASLAAARGISVGDIPLELLKGRLKEAGVKLN